MTVPNGDNNLRRSDVLPIERDAKKAEPFVSVSTAEEVRDHILSRGRRVLRGKTKNVDSVQKRENVRREDLPDEHPSERGPKEFQALLVL